MAYQPIENYGIVGNMHTAALVGQDGSIDWFCFPRFDSPSVFAALLDDQKGGRFKITPLANNITSKQFYWPDSNVLITDFLSTSGAGRLIDFMPVGLPRGHAWHHSLIRRVTALRASMAFQVECRPAFNYARDPHQLRIAPQGACFDSPGLTLGLMTEVSLRNEGGAAQAEFTLEEGENATFVLQGLSMNGCHRPLEDSEACALVQSTVQYWQRWLSKCTYRGRWNEMVRRSALVLELLTYEPTGAVVAAPTSSLPEGLGKTRNWDYRYSWIRDAAFTVYGLLRVGLTDEATRFMSWIESLCRQAQPDGSLQTVYRIDGRCMLPEETLDHLEGYKGSRPVRIGNAASEQVQLDIYGELVDSVYLYNKHVSPISSELWEDVRKLIDWVCENWQRKDNGIWELRTEPQEFVYSKLMCWVALDRGLRLAQKRSLPADRPRWLTCRDRIYEQLLTKAWSENRQAFVQYYGSESLDAANLLLSMVFFMSPLDPKMLKTLDAIKAPLSKGGLVFGSAVQRYNTRETKQGLNSDEGTFNICTFWLVEALTRAGRTDPRRLNEASFLFERMLKQANHLGLYSEEMGVRGEALGNFPQAFTHLGLISAAYNLDRALGPGNRQ